jgi:hypothetical protein
MQNFPDSGGKQFPIVSTLVHAIIRRFFAGESGVLFMDMSAEIRRRNLVSKESILGADAKHGICPEGPVPRAVDAVCSRSRPRYACA